VGYRDSRPRADIVADLSTADGRSQAVAAIVERSAGVRDGL